VAVHFWVTASVQVRLTRPLRLRRAFSVASDFRHRALLLALLDEAAEGARSPLEIRDPSVRTGLPPGTRQAGQRRTEVDVLYEKYALLVERDGRRGHEGEGRLRDMRRDKAATTNGLATLRCGWVDLIGRGLARLRPSLRRTSTPGCWRGFLRPCDLPSSRLTAWLVTWGPPRTRIDQSRE
jgi:hypothetical protein